MTACSKAALCAAGFMTSIATSSALPADDHEMAPDIVRSFYVKVKNGEMRDYIAGVKAYVDCYRENGGKNGWTAWVPQSGGLNAMGFRSYPGTWADFDEKDPAGEACNETYMKEALPHTHGIYSEFTKLWLKVSNPGTDEVKVVEVIDFDFKDTRAAYKTMEKFKEGLDAAGWDGYVWEVNETKNGRWDASIALLNKSFSGLADPDPNFYQIQVAHHGEDEANKLFDAWDENIKDVSVNIYTKVDDGGYSPSDE